MEILYEVITLFYYLLQAFLQIKKKSKKYKLHIAARSVLGVGTYQEYDFQRVFFIGYFYRGFFSPRYPRTQSSYT